MKNILKVLSLAFVLTLTVAACGDKRECDKDCQKECCADKDAKACEPGCEKECCKGKTETMMGDSTMHEMHGNEQAHVCTDQCQSDPHSCPNHKH
jgi:hypothetical protein